MAINLQFHLEICLRARAAPPLILTAPKEVSILGIAVPVAHIERDAILTTRYGPLFDTMKGRMQCIRHSFPQLTESLEMETFDSFFEKLDPVFTEFYYNLGSRTETLSLEFDVFSLEAPG